MSEDTQTPVRVNPAKVIYDQVSVEKKLGSRISRRQLAAVIQTDDRPDIAQDDLMSYAVSGETDALKDADRLALRAFVAKCKEHELLATESQKRRLWPRKVAAILAFVNDEA